MTGILIFALRVLLVVALYAFLARALYTIWRDLKMQSELISGRQVPTLSLALLGSSEPGLREYTVSEIIIGRDPSCDYTLTDGTVSSRHARLSYHHNQWWVEDLQSTNGTFLNDERVGSPIVIISGDDLRCGQEALRIDIQAQS